MINVTQNGKNVDMEELTLPDSIVKMIAEIIDK
jgi:hypothetical protein